MSPVEITRANLNAGRSRRWRDVVRPQDVHGRRYVVWIDRAAGDVVGVIDRQFSAPVIVPDHYHHVPEDKRWRIEIDYLGYIAELKAAEARWTAEVRRLMVHFHGEKGIDDVPSRQVLDAVGPRPQNWRLVELARRGDPWLLGLPGKDGAPAKPSAVALAIDPTLGRAPERVIDDIPGDLRLEPELEALARASGRRPVPRFVDEREAAEAYQRELAAREAEEADDDVLTGTGHGTQSAIASDLAGFDDDDIPLSGDALDAYLDGEQHEDTLTGRRVPMDREPDGTRKTRKARREG